MTEEEKLSATLDRTAQLHEAVAAHVDRIIPCPEKRFVVSFQAGILSLEHAMGALVLIDNGLFASGIALVRPQFETLVRGIWLLYGATEEWVDKLSEPLTVNSARQANEGPSLSEMLKKLDSSKVQPQLVDQLKQFHEVAWKALCSYTHGGIHPLSRTLTGYPAPLATDALRNSNALVSITAQLVSILSGDPENMHPIRKLYVDFADCLPLVPPPVQA
ncbi:DUF6988 family protein [Ralstonia soli]|uniref:Uncharacterized protein n=1 Tax=Ralstonia soli TaxID=2953896 RepID=A0ABT1ASS4_9RALS|nr:hypothetical protein [Ralstonia soli]MCO5401515.1 hypothetical protein [Ralstonia soli]